MEDQPKKKSGIKKFLRWLGVIFIVALIISIWWEYYFVYGVGVKSGGKFFPYACLPVGLVTNYFPPAYLTNPTPSIIISNRLN